MPEKKPFKRALDAIFNDIVKDDKLNWFSNKPIITMKTAITTPVQTPHFTRSKRLVYEILETKNTLARAPNTEKEINSGSKNNDDDKKAIKIIVATNANVGVEKTAIIIVKAGIGIK